MLLTKGPLEQQAKYLLPGTLLDQPPDETTLLMAENGSLLAPYRRGIIGRHDPILDPMVPPGSIVYIDTRSRAISRAETGSMSFSGPSIS
jgi:hypothetical protein